MTRKRLRPLHPSSVRVYRAVLKRAFGDAEAPFRKPSSDLRMWAPSQLSILRAAVQREYAQLREDPTEMLDQIPDKWQVKKVGRFMTEDEARCFELEAQALPKGKRALVLLLLRLGLRSAEALTIAREHAQRAVKTGSLVIVRKGGKEQSLPCRREKGLLKELLSVPAAHGQKWASAGEVLTTRGFRQQYKLLLHAVRGLGSRANIPAVTPHKLRHAYATRLEDLGASIPQIQWALGHASPVTTSKYVHVQSRKLEELAERMPELPALED